MIGIIKEKVATIVRKIIQLKYELTDIRNSYLSSSLTTQTTPYGFKFTGSRSIHHRGMQNGTFEPEETALFQELFKRVDVFIDVGANIGFYSCLARHQGMHVVAIEPMAQNLEYAYVNFQGNNWPDIEVYPLGLSNVPGTSTLFGASSTGASLIKNWAGASRLFHRTIALTTLDILLGDRFVGKKLLIKIDVEGYEYQVLSSALRTMAMNPKPVWVVEVCLEEYHPDGINPYFKNLFELFWAHNYEVRTADETNSLIERKNVDNWIDLGSCDSGTINYKFLPKS